jgi:hypothetical protein
MSGSQTGCINKLRSAPALSWPRAQCLNRCTASAASSKGLGVRRADAMLGIVLVFALPLLIAGAMIDPAGPHFGGLLAYSAIMFVVLPFIGWSSFLIMAAYPAAGDSRARSVLSFWVGGTVTAVAVINWIYSVLGYPRPGARIDPFGHALIPFAPRTGLAIGLFELCMLVSCGCWGAIAPILRPEVAIKGAFISGCVLFGLLYGAGWILVTRQ